MHPPAAAVHALRPAALSSPIATRCRQRIFPLRKRHEDSQAAQLCPGFVGRRRRRRGRAERGQRRRDRRDGQQGPGFQGDARSCPQGRGPGAAAPDLPRARAHAEGARQCGDGAQGGALRALLRHRRHPHRQLDRHRGRRGDALLLLVQGPARIAQRPCADRRRDGAALARRQLRRPARLHPAPGRRGPYQRVQLPGLGNARETGPDPARRGSGDREAGERDRLSHRARGPDHDRGGRASERRPAIDHGRDRRPHGPSHLPGRGELHRLGGDRDEAADPSRDRARNRSASSPSATASTPRSSAPMPGRARRSSTCSSRRSRAK